MSQVTEQSVRCQTALTSIKLIQASAALDLTEEDFDCLTSNKVWIATDRSRARRSVDSCGYATLASVVFFFQAEDGIRDSAWLTTWTPKLMEPSVCGIPASDPALLTLHV